MEKQQQEPYVLIAQEILENIAVVARLQNKHLTDLEIIAANITETEQRVVQPLLDYKMRQLQGATTAEENQQIANTVTFLQEYCVKEIQKTQLFFKTAKVQEYQAHLQAKDTIQKFQQYLMETPELQNNQQYKQIEEKLTEQIVAAGKLEQVRDEISKQKIDSVLQQYQHIFATTKATAPIAPALLGQAIYEN